jgi:cobalt-zinc-cadmium efflux system protein
MGHHHEHTHRSKGLTLAFWLNLLFSIIEVVGGIFTNSTAIIADAFHDFMDALAIGAAVLLEKISGKKRTAKYSYGYKRFSLLGALGMSVFLLVGAILMSISAVKTLLAPEVVNSTGMLWLAVLGILINGFAFLRIKNGSAVAHHHPGHSHDHNHNSKAIMLHLLEDVLGWVAVLVGAVMIHFTGWYWIDGLLALGIAGFIGYNASVNLFGTLKVLLQSVPENINLVQLAEELQRIEGVENIHDLHIWSLDGSYHVGSLHAVLSEETAVTKQAEVHNAILGLMDRFRIQHPTVQIETEGSSCRLRTC